MCAAQTNVYTAAGDVAAHYSTAEELNERPPQLPPPPRQRGIVLEQPYEVEQSATGHVTVRPTARVGCGFFGRVWRPAASV